MINLCDTCEQTICSANTKNVVFSDNGDIIKCDKYNSNNFSSINLESLFPNNLTDAEQKDIIKNISPNDIDNFFNYLNKRMKDSLSYNWIKINGEDKNEED